MDVDVVDINQNYEIFKKTRVNPQNDTHLRLSSHTSAESPTDLGEQFLTDHAVDHASDDEDKHNDDDEIDDEIDDDSPSVASREGFVKRRIERWERLSQGEDFDATAPVDQGQQSPELRGRDLPVPVVIPPRFLHGSVSLRGSRAESEFSFIRSNVIHMKADFQMTELKLKYAKWQYDVNKGNKGPLKPQQSNPGLSWSSESTSLPNIAENMAVRRRGEGSPTVAQQMSLASFGSDGRIRDTSGHNLVAHQRLLSSFGTRDQHLRSVPSYATQGQLANKVHQGQTSDVPSKMSQPRAATSLHGHQGQSSNTSSILKHTYARPPGHQGQLSVKVDQGQMPNAPQTKRSHVALYSQGHQGQVIDSERTEQIDPSKRAQTNALGLEELELRLKNISHQDDQERTQPQHTLVAPIKPFRDDQSRSHRTGGSSGMHLYHQRTNREGYHYPRDPHQFGHQNRDNWVKDYQHMDQHHRNQENFNQRHRDQHDMSHRQINIQHWSQHHHHQDQQHLDRHHRDQQHLDHHHLDQHYLDHTNKNDQYSHAQKGNHYQRAQQHVDRPQIDQQEMQQEQRIHQLQGHQRIDNQQRNMQHKENQQREIYQRGHQHSVAKSGISNIPRLRTHHGQSTRIIPRGDIMARTNQDLNQLKEERTRLLKDFGNILVEQEVRQNNKAGYESESSPGGLSEGSGYDKDFWDMETSESTVENYDVGTQYPCPGEETYCESFESIESVQDESRYSIEGSAQAFQSSECTYDVCIQVSVRRIDKVSTERVTSLLSSRVNNENEKSVDLVQDQLLQYQEPSTLLHYKPKDNGQNSLENVVEDIVHPVSLPNDNVKRTNVDINHDSFVEDLEQNMATSEPQEISTEAALGIEEELVPYLICSQTNTKPRSSSVRDGNMLEELAQGMHQFHSPAIMRQQEESPEVGHEDQPPEKTQIDKKKVVVEESVPHIKCSQNHVKFSANGPHREDLLEQLGKDIENSDAPTDNELKDHSIVTFSPEDEPLNETEKCRANVVEEFVPRLESSNFKIQFSAKGAYRENVLDSLAQEMDNSKNAGVPVESSRTGTHVDEDSHVSGDIIKPQRAETQEQELDLSSLGEMPQNGQFNKEGAVVDDHTQRRKVLGHGDNSNSPTDDDDGVKILRRELDQWNSTDNELADEPRSVLHDERISEEVNEDKSNIRNETPLDQGTSARPGKMNKGVEEPIRSRRLPQHDAHSNTNNAERDIALGNLTKEIEKSTRPVVDPEKYGNESDDGKLPVIDKFHEVLVCDKNQAVEKLNLPSPKELNESQYTSIREAGSPLVSTMHSSPNAIYMSPDMAENEESHLNGINQSTKPIRGIENFTLTEDKELTHETAVLQGDGGDNPHVGPGDLELSCSLDITAERDLPPDRELAIDEPSDTMSGLTVKGDKVIKDCVNDIVSNVVEIEGPKTPKRSKIPVPKSKFPRSTSCPIHGYTDKKAFKRKQETPKFNANTGDESLMHHQNPDKSLDDDFNVTSREFSDSFSRRNETTRLSLRGEKGQKSRIPVSSNFKRTGSLPMRSRTAMGWYSSPASHSQNTMKDANLRGKGFKPNISNTGSKDIDITNALAISDIEGTAASSTEQSPRVTESRNPTTLHGKNTNAAPSDNKEPLSLSPSETDEFIKTAKDILLRISAAQSQVPETHPESLNIHLSDGDTNEDLEGGFETDVSYTPSPGRELDFLALEAQLKDEDTLSETYTLHSENDSEIRSPLYDEVFRLDQEEKQKFSKSRIPVLKGSHKPVKNHRRVSGSTDTEDETISENSGKERSIARISPMPREVDDDLIETPTLHKPTESRIPIVSPVPIKQTSKGTRTRSYSEADGDIEMAFDEPEEIGPKEYDDAEDDEVENHHFDSEQIIPPRRTQSSREVRPRGSYWAFSTSPRLAATEFERSQTLRLNRPKGSGGRSPARTPRGTPRTTPGVTPRATPRVTPKVTPKSTPKSTPKATPRVSPKVTPRGTPRETPTPSHMPKDSSPRDGTLGRQHQHPKTPPTFKSRECAFVPLPEWNRLREVLASGEQSKKGSIGPSTPSDYSSRRSSDASRNVKSPNTPKQSRYRIDGRVPAHLKKKYAYSASMSDVSGDTDFYPFEQDKIPPGAEAQETDSPWMLKSSIRRSLSSQSVPHDEIPYGVKVRKADGFRERTTTSTTSEGRSPTASAATADRPRSPSGTEAINNREQSSAASEAVIKRGHSPTASQATTDTQPVTPADDVSTIWTEDDTLDSSNFSLQSGAKRKSWRRRFSLRKKKSGDKSGADAKESEEAKQKKRRKNWLLKFLGIRK